MPADLVTILRQTTLLGQVPDADLTALAAVSRVRQYRRGQIVFSRGDPGDSLIAVVSGRVKVVVRSADGGELTLTILGPGAVLGEISVADGGPRSTDAETIEDCRLLLIPGEAVQAVCARVPAAAQALTTSVAATLRRLTDAAADLVFLDLPRRVAKMLLTQPRDATGAIQLELSQEQLARHVGGTRQSVNAALKGFEKRGWLDLHDRAVTVRDPAALSRFAGT